MIYKLHIIDEYGERHQLTFKNQEFPSLMEFLRDELGTEIGDCRGRIWCNTCAVEQCYEKIEPSTLGNDERRLLKAIPVSNTRLSCQLELTEKLNGTTWRILDSRRFI